MTIFSLAFSIFLVMNIAGSIPIFLALLGKYPIKRQRQIIFREMISALIILLCFMFFGKHILHFLGISQSTMGVAGGIILFIIGLGLIFPKKSDIAEFEADEPFIVPLAMPLIAGPGTITTLIIYADQVKSSMTMLLVLLLAWVPSILILLVSANLKKYLGQKGLNAIQRFGGMLICLIAVQMVCNGTIAQIKESFQ
jgi:multiple antibiotic resistance protein